MYRKAIELDPSHAMAHNNLGLLLQYVRKDYDGAEKMYRKAIELDPSHANVGRVAILRQRAVFRCQLGSFLEQFKRAGVVASLGVRAAPVREDACVRRVARERLCVRTLGAFQVVQAHARVAEVRMVRGVAWVRFHRLLKPRFRLQ